jgi:hypothetical protein
MYSSGDMLKTYFDNGEFDKMINYLSNSKLEAIGTTNIISKSFTSLERVNKFDKIIEILNIIAKYKIEVFGYELKEGLRILINTK